jgi:hypothetical protein
MAIIKAVRSGASIGRAVNYVTDQAKTEPYLISGIGCRPSTAIEEMNATKALYGKESGRQYKHFVQSFAVGEITAPEAHKIAWEWAQNKLFKGHEILITTHTDTEHIHSHFVVNSVSFEDGRKLQQSKHDLQMLKAYNDELCHARGLSIPEPSRNITSMKGEQYRAIQRAVEGKYKDWQLEIMNSVSDVKGIATSKDEFIGFLKEKGITVDWQDKHKYITFTDGEGHKARDKTLEKIFKEPLSKEVLENELSGIKERAISDRTITSTKRGQEEGLGKHTTEGSISSVERELRDVVEGVKKRTTRGREEQAERLQESKRRHIRISRPTERRYKRFVRTDEREYREIKDIQPEIRERNRYPDIGFDR